MYDVTLHILYGDSVLVCTAIVIYITINMVKTAVCHFVYHYCMHGDSVTLCIYRDRVSLYKTPHT